MRLNSLFSIRLSLVTALVLFGFVFESHGASTTVICTVGSGSSAKKLGQIKLSSGTPAKNPLFDNVTLYVEAIPSMRTNQSLQAKLSGQQPAVRYNASRKTHSSAFEIVDSKKPKSKTIPATMSVVFNNQPFKASSRAVANITVKVGSLSTTGVCKIQ